MVKVFVAYDSKYGNTKLAGESIVEGIREVEGVEAAIGYVKEIDVERLAEHEVIVIGAPNHMGRPSQTIKKFVNKLAELELETKSVAVFGTYAGKARDPDRAVKKMEKMLQKKLPDLKLISPSLSVRVHGVKGPVAEGELLSCEDFGRIIADQLKRRVTNE